jgi:hypothetical protein
MAYLLQNLTSEASAQATVDMVTEETVGTRALESMAVSVEEVERAMTERAEERTQFVAVRETLRHLRQAETDVGRRVDLDILLDLVEGGGYL